MLQSRGDGETEPKSRVDGTGSSMMARLTAVSFLIVAACSDADTLSVDAGANSGAPVDSGLSPDVLPTPLPDVPVEDGGTAPDIADLGGADASQPDAAPSDAMVLPDAGTPGDPPPPARPGLRGRVCGNDSSFDILETLPSAETVLDAATPANGEERDFGFLEGPVWSEAAQALFFSDFNDRGPLASDDRGPPTILYRWDPRGQLDVFSPEGEIRSNGLAIDEQGAIIAATHDVRGISRVDPLTGERTVMVSEYEGQSFNTTNDLVVASDGTVYFTDPAYNGQLDGRPRALDFEGVFRLTSDGTLELLEDSFERPNGITLSPDEDLLYVASRGDNATYRFSVNPNGSVGPPEVFSSGRDASADGVAIDCAGNLYLAVPNRGIQVYRPDGTRIGAIPNTRAVTNAAFGGASHRDLYITERQVLKVVRDWPIPGLPY